MAERKRKYQTEKTKQKIRDTIKTQNIIDTLQEHVDGETTLKGTQIKAAEILLNRTMPVLSHNKNEEVQEQRGPQEIKDQLQTLLNDLDQETLDQLQLLMKEQPECHNPGEVTQKLPTNTNDTSSTGEPKANNH